jgi:V/A-type H+-transporting ATPase subunit I
MEEMKSEEARMADAQENLQKATVYIEALTRHFTSHSNKANYDKADLSMEELTEGKLLSLSGWLPAGREKEVSEFLQKFSLYFLVSDPGPDEEVPVLLKNNRFSKLFEPITKIFALPSYMELDPTPFFAPFFAFFFGICLGDVGYGAIILIGAVIMLYRVSDALKPIMKLGIILGLMTILNGVFLNTFFGQAIFAKGYGSQAIFSGGGALAVFGSYSTADGRSVSPAMPFSIMLGVIQVMLGIGLQAYNKISNYGWAWGLQPISYLMMIAGGIVWAAHGNAMDLGTLEIGPLPVGAALTTVPGFIGPMFVIGGLLVLFAGNNPDKKIFFRPLLGLWELYGFITDLMGNVLSYLRLFALGLASALLGNAFNQIAFMFVRQEDGSLNLASIGIVGTVLVLVVGHTLNLGLSALGSFVHPLRLTFVEFYKNLQFKGGGQAYSPFSVQKSI